MRNICEFVDSLIVRGLGLTGTFCYRGKGGFAFELGRAASHRKMLSAAAAESDAVGSSGAADSAERDRPDSAAADVQLSESHFDLQTTTAGDASFGMRGRR